jgi:hypothetical protein
MPAVAAAAEEALTRCPFRGTPFAFHLWRGSAVALRTRQVDEDGGFFDAAPHRRIRVSQLRSHS